MNPTTIYTVVFSPTGTSRRVAAAVAQGLARSRGSLNTAENADNTPGTAESGMDAEINAGIETGTPKGGAVAGKGTVAGTEAIAGIGAVAGIETVTGTGADAGTGKAGDGSTVKAFTTIDLTHAAGKAVVLPAQAVAVFAVPVYGGCVAPAALERLREIRGLGTPAVVLAVYGNRAFGKAVAQLAAVVAERGFVPVAAGAFVGEHSYSTPGTPIAAGRPDAQDLAEAAAFGTRIGEKLAHGERMPIDAAKLREPHTPLLSKLRFIRFVLGYRRRQKRNPVVLLPAGDAARCTQCGRCVALCPTQAIARGDELHTDPARCIRCCACVKGCSFGARTFETPFAAALSRNFARRKPPVTLM